MITLTIDGQEIRTDREGARTLAAGRVTHGRIRHGHLPRRGCPQSAAT